MDSPIPPLPGQVGLVRHVINSHAQLLSSETRYLCRVIESIPWQGFKEAFKEGRESIKDDEHVERPSTSRNAENAALVSECVRKDRLQTLAQIAEATCFLKTLFEGIRLSQTALVLAE
ncbi:hypothetical protein TNCV_3983061 [Trichonephila clavipes]|nr:hypothetical protein TNCV_3983061 [Trichonephila clavipes]